ncbi:MAG TPA: hypothetical protein VN756_08870 [Solirubrobacterales bacterium]|nr:hypothetical protein [Solirubrobacterales bacterium]
MYVTPKRFEKMGLGVSLTGVPSYQIREHLLTAAAAVDAFCNVPLYPQRYSFKGGLITGEQQGFRDRYKRRIYPLHTPLKNVTSLRIEATNNLYIDFETQDWFINRHEGYVELINFALTKVGIWGQADVPSLGLSEPVSVMDYSYGHTFPVIDEELVCTSTTSGEEDWTEYMAFNGFWDPDEEITVKRNGTALVEDTDFGVDLDGGFVTLVTPAAESDTLTASYTYRVPWEVARANALGAAEYIGEARLKQKGMTGIESIEVEEVRLRRIGSRSGAEKGVDLPAAAQNLLMGLRFMTIRG